MYLRMGSTDSINAGVNAVKRVRAACTVRLLAVPLALVASKAIGSADFNNAYFLAVIMVRAAGTTGQDMWEMVLEALWWVLEESWLSLLLALSPPPQDRL